VTNFTQYTLSQHITLEDWTEDKIPEIVFDFTNDTGGSGYVETTWERYIISCQENCYVVWSGMTGQIRSYYSKGLTTTNIEKTIDENGDIAIILVKESFNAPALFSHPLIAGVEATVKASVFEIYTWNGQTFEQTEQKILSPAYELESKSILTANNETGDIVFIDSVFVDDDPFLPIYNCTLVLNGEAIGLPFECDANFSTVEWIDMTNDGHPEIVVKALAFEFQHLIAFQWDGATAIQIADIMGDIVRSDLYGVRLEDVDGDGQLEILAGSGYLSEGIECNHFEGDYGRYSEVCWHELSVDDVIYKWDGASFVLWEGGR
jgi:hypothetical protein